MWPGDEFVLAAEADYESPSQLAGSVCVGCESLKGDEDV